MKKRIFAMLVVICLLLGMFPVRAQAAEEVADIYVATTGADTNAGTERAPVLSLNKALELVENGGKIHIVDRFIAPAGFVWDNHSKDVTITGGTLDLSQGYTEKTENGGAVKCYFQGDGVTYDNLELILPDGAYYFANGLPLQVNENVTVTGKDIQLFGGGYREDVDAADVKLLAGNYLKVYGGGFYAKVNGDVKLFVGKINPKYTVSHDGKTCVYGGSLGNGVRGNIYLTLDGANVDWVKGVTDSGTAYQDVKVLISGGNYYSVYGGGGGACPVAGDIDLTITGGTFAQVFGGNELLGHQGNVTVKLMGGTITRRFFGGCYNEYSVLSGYSTQFYVAGKISVYLFEGMNFRWNTSESDIGMFACSRHKTQFEDEVSAIYYMNAAAKTKHASSLGAQNTGMKLAMGSSAAAADTISLVEVTTQVAKWNMTLGDAIGANFYMQASEEIASISAVKATVAGETESYQLSEITPDADGLYLISVPVAAAQMTEDIHLQLVVGDIECNSVRFTVRDYAETILEGDYEENAKNLVRHMLNYGAAAQAYFDVNTDALANAGYEMDYEAQYPDSIIRLQDFTFRGEKFGGDYGPIKLGGVWLTSKEDFTKIQVENGDVVDMTATEPTPEEPEEIVDYLVTPNTLQELADIGAVSTMVKVSEDPAWGSIQSQATIKAGEAITPLGVAKSTVVDSPIKEGHFNPDGATYPLLAVDCAWSKLDTETQDVMFYIELPAECSWLRFNAFTCNSWTLWVSPKGMQYQYLAVGGDNWKNGQISNDDNKNLSLPQGFKGYVRLKIDTAENAASFPDKQLTIQEFQFRVGRFGGDFGPVKLGGVWFVSKEGFKKIKIGDGDILNMTYTKYLTSSVQLQETAELGEAAKMVKVSEDPAWGGISSQATIQAAKGITPLGLPKAAVVDSPIKEGYLNADGATYPLMSVDCAWSRVDTTAQDVMFYIELPEASSQLRLWAFTCNSWTFWLSPKGMQYQYLPVDGDTWQDGQISNDDNKKLALPQGFKGYVRLKLDTAENAAAFPDTTLQIQEFTCRFDTFGGEYGPVKLGGVWLVSKENYTKLKVGDSDVRNMVTVQTVEIAKAATAETPVKLLSATGETESSGRNYITAIRPAQEFSKIGEASSMVELAEDPAWGGIQSQATVKAGEGITIIGDEKSTVIDSPISEGYFHSDGQTYPLFRVNCGWKSVDTKKQDLMFYIELPEECSEIRLNAFACNNWSLWLSPSGMRYQYLEANSNIWKSGKISNDANKCLSLPLGFKGYVRLKLDTAENAGEIANYNPIQAISGEIDGLQYHGASLLVDSKIAVRYYFAGDNVDGVTFTAKNTNYTAKEKDGLFYVDVPGINPQEYSDIMAIAATKGDQRLEVTYGPLNYMVHMRKKGSDSMKALVNAMYGYHEAAVAYVNKEVAAPESWLDAFSDAPYEIFDFSEGKDMYGDKTINIIGDSISQGLNSDLFYDNSWASLFKEAIAKKYGTYNLGYVSLLARTNEAVPGREMHTLSFPNGDWERYFVSGNTPGGMSYATHTQGSILRLDVNRCEGGKDRHINGFYIYYPEGPYRSAFTVKVNGQELAVINANKATENGCARSQYIPLPKNCPDNIQIDLVAGDCTNKSVIISGISYIDDPNDLIVNNYSLSGIRLADISDATLQNMCKANVVILTLGTNDSGTGIQISEFRRKLDLVKTACEENGSLLIVGNMIWDRANDPNYAAEFRAALQETAEAANGHFIDMNTARVRSDKFLEASRPWDVHPTVIGHKLIAQVLCEYLENCK